MPLDIVRITGWKKQPKDMPSEKPEVRYAASFAGYVYLLNAMVFQLSLTKGKILYSLIFCGLVLKCRCRFHAKI